MSRYRSNYWLWLVLGILMGATALYILAVGKPWEALPFGSWLSGSEEAVTGTGAGARAIEASDAAAYDTEYGNIGVTDEFTTACQTFTETLYSTGHRKIAAGFEDWRTDVKEQMGTTAKLSFSGEELDPDDFLENHAEEMIQGRIEMDCTFTPEYEIPKTGTTAYVNGTMKVTVYSASNLTYPETLFGLENMNPAKAQEIPFGFYLAQDGETGEWKVQETRCGYYTP